MPRKRERASLFYARKVLEEKEAEVSSLGPRMPGGRHMTFGEQIWDQLSWITGTTQTTPCFNWLGAQCSELEATDAEKQKQILELQSVAELQIAEGEKLQGFVEGHGTKRLKGFLGFSMHLLEKFVDRIDLTLWILFAFHNPGPRPCLQWHVTWSASAVMPFPQDPSGDQMR